MEKIFLKVGILLILNISFSCNNSNNQGDSTTGEYPYDSSDTMYDQQRSLSDTLADDTLSTDSIIPPTPMQEMN